MSSGLAVTDIKTGAPKCSSRYRFDEANQIIRPDPSGIVGGTRPGRRRPFVASGGGRRDQPWWILETPGPPWLGGGKKAGPGERNGEGRFTICRLQPEYVTARIPTGAQFRGSWRSKSGRRHAVRRGTGGWRTAISRVDAKEPGPRRARNVLGGRRIE